MTLKLNGSSSGSVSIDAPASTTSGADITFKLPVADGSANQLLKTDASGNLGWITSAVGGKLLKVQHASHSSTVNHPSNSSAYVDTGLTMDFTATASDSTLLIFLAQNGAEFRSAGGAGWSCQLQRDGSNLVSNDRVLTGYKELSGYCFFMHSMSAGDTSSHTFKSRTANHHGDSSGSAQYNSAPSTMIILEVGA